MQITAAHLEAYVTAPLLSEAAEFHALNQTLLALACVMRDAGVFIFHFLKRDVKRICGTLFALEELGIAHLATARTLREALLQAADNPAAELRPAIPSLQMSCMEWLWFIRGRIWTKSDEVPAAVFTEGETRGSIVDATVRLLPRKGLPISLSASCQSRGEGLVKCLGRRLHEKEWLYGADPVRARTHFLTDCHHYDLMYGLAQFFSLYFSGLPRVGDDDIETSIYFDAFLSLTPQALLVLPFRYSEELSGHIHASLANFPYLFELRVQYGQESTIYIQVNRLKTSLHITFLSLRLHANQQVAKLQGIATFFPALLAQVMLQLGYDNLTVSWDTWMNPQNFSDHRFFYGCTTDDEEPLTKALSAAGFQDHRARGLRYFSFALFNTPFPAARRLWLLRPLADDALEFCTSKPSLPVKDLMRAWEIVHKVKEAP